MSEQKTSYHGSCHCGAIRFAYEGEPISAALRCNCSICVRKGALMTPETIAEEDLKIEAQPSSLGLYQFGEKTAKHFFCKQCGIYPFHETARKAGHYRCNIGCIEEIEDPLALDVTVFDGKHLL